MFMRSCAKRVVLAICVVVLGGVPVDGQVVSKKPMPTPRMAGAGAVVDGKIYIIGGVSSQGRMVGTVEEYDPAKDVWTARASMPTARGMLAAVAVGSTIYAIGGRSNAVLSIVEAYDVKADRWTQAASLPTGRWGLMAAVVGGRLLAIGGITGMGAARQSVGVVDTFDPTKNVWTAGRALPLPLQSAAAVSHDGQVFLVGGRAGAGDTGTATDSVYTWNDGANWASGPRLLQPRTGAAAAVAAASLVVVGGAAGGTPSSSIDVLSLGQSKWARSGFALSAARTGHVVESVNGKIYVIGGATQESLAGITGAVEEITIRAR